MKQKREIVPIKRFSKAPLLKCSQGHPFLSVMATLGAGNALVLMAQAS
jgi:hypothetical protein